MTDPSRPADDSSVPAVPSAAFAYGTSDPIAVIRDTAQSLLRGPPHNLTDQQRRSLATIIEQVQWLRHPVGTQGTRGPRASASVALVYGRQPLPSILLAEDDEDVAAALLELLSSHYQVTLARDGAEAIAALRLQAFDLAILDVGLPILDGFHLVRALKSEKRQLPTFMFLSGRSDPRTKIAALALGAVDYVTKPFEPGELLARIAGILATGTREAGLRADARTDALTGLGNYKGFAESLDRELERSRRYGLPISLLTIDVDNLKAINDEHGHEAGDEAIRVVASVLASGVRRFETVVRQGGDEFAIILPNTACADAKRLAERLRGAIGLELVRGAPLSVSIGGAAWEHKAPIAAVALIKASDEALYRAKRSGRDRVDVADMAAADQE